VKLHPESFKITLRYYIELIALHRPEKMMNAIAQIEHSHWWFSN